MVKVALNLCPFRRMCYAIVFTVEDNSQFVMTGTQTAIGWSSGGEVENGMVKE